MGCKQKKLKADGSVSEYQWFDESRLVSTGKFIKGYVCPKTSGPEQNAPNL
jgi:hypothetical protein